MNFECCIFLLESSLCVDSNWVIKRINLVLNLYIKSGSPNPSKYFSFVNTFYHFSFCDKSFPYLKQFSSSIPCGSTSDFWEFITWDNLHLGLQPLILIKFLAPLQGSWFEEKIYWDFLSLSKLHHLVNFFPTLSIYSCIIFNGWFILPTC